MLQTVTTDVLNFVCHNSCLYRKNACALKKL